ncbi:MAG: hypothetical protein E6J90_10585 [Deltaproteobacteria bacterium]|nr:MAG: hypothetical protein E6J91_30570 [Deltaproteobacteria bacterium]TMQ23430.1 MAG: hypothetical protein E6J90_10585 [Deltaproteobacteria bacterium]
MSDETKSDKLSMRTALYIEHPTTLTIRAPQSSGTPPLLFRYNQSPPQPAIGTHRLEPGIYLLMSANQLEISNAGVTTHLLAGSKDVPPDPQASLLKSEKATPDAVREFFELARGLDD